MGPGFRFEPGRFEFEKAHRSSRPVLEAAYGPVPQPQPSDSMNTSTFPALQRTRLTMHLGLCAAALVGSLATVSVAQATVTTFSTPIVVPNNFDGVYLNLLSGATGSSGASNPGWDFNPYNSGTALSFFWNNTAPSVSGGVGVSPTGAYSVLNPGDTISAASSFSNGTAAANTAGFQSAGTRYLGFRFYNENTATINYGYMTLTSAGTNGFPLTIEGWSFENSGGPITVSVVPETSTALMMSVGALALGALKLRRRRQGGTAAS